MESNIGECNINFIAFFKIILHSAQAPCAISFSDCNEIDIALNNVPYLYNIRGFAYLKRVIIHAQ